LLYSDATYEDHPSTKAGLASQWVVRGGTWKDYPLIINEPAGCRAGVADEVKIVDHAGDYLWNNRRWNMVRVRLKRDKTCDLELISSRLSDDPQAGAFFAGFTMLRACRDAYCNGPVLGTEIRSRLEPQ
jgi:hypothetical protein